ncbi:DUF4025 domain-containing protein [Virgibacillus kimchii]
MQNREQTDHEEKANAGKAYHPEHQEKEEEKSMTREQVENTYKDGTIDRSGKNAEK